ncbi:CBS domain-containing protein [archaeon]|nr:CBS domain-containing protein [archaeon]
MKTVGGIMTKPVKTIGPGETIGAAAEMMKKNRIGSLVVVKKDEPVGIVTERDIAYKLVAEGKGSDTKVKDVMSTDLKTISEDKSLMDAAKLMAAHVIRRLPVVKNGKVVGIVAIEDIMRSERIGEDPDAYSFS